MTSQTLVRLQKEHPGYCWICGKRTTQAHTCYERVTLTVLKSAITDLDRQIAEKEAQLAEADAAVRDFGNALDGATNMCGADGLKVRMIHEEVVDAAFNRGHNFSAFHAALAREEARAKNKETK